MHEYIQYGVQGAKPYHSFELTLSLETFSEPGGYIRADIVQ